MRGLLGAFLFLILAIALAYISRFWPLRLWGPEPLLGALPPGGDLWRSWMRMIGLGAYDLILWGVFAFALLTGAERLWSRFGKHA